MKIKEVIGSADDKRISFLSNQAKRLSQQAKQKKAQERLAKAQLDLRNAKTTSKAPDARPR